ncbi:MAG TPA: 3-deoxy-7-phosphoheptulonate synthase [Planctomycetota bacterium]|nr:3-deoxy-7-phosphoheptulonate synthase [Planctomycetota bacterium]
MIVRLRPGTAEHQVQALRARLEERGLRCMRSPELRRPILTVVGSLDASTRAELERDAAVEDCLEPRAGLVMVARESRDEPSVVAVGGRGAPVVRVGGGEVVVVAGPCSVESRESVLEIAHAVQAAGAHILRGGAFKPRTSPHAFQGLGVEGLRQLKRAGEAVGLPVVSEIMDATDVSTFVDEGIDCLQIGARNMQNFTLLKAVAHCGLPVVLKRGLAATVDEWLAAAEYLAGAAPVILCERGIRTFERATRNTLDLTVLPLLREWTHLPILVDPAHAAGIARVVPPLARAAVAAGADGVAVEVHPRPSEALSDGPQALLPAQLTRLVGELRVMAAVTGRRLHA